jgi:Protein of unknown function (DUF2510)
MPVDDAPGTVTILKHGWNSLRADDHGLTVREGPRVRRFAWAEVSRLVDGSAYIQGSYDWVLLIVLRSGRKVRVHGAPTPETLAAVRQVAARYGIPVDVTGVPVKGERPARRGLYEDPGGRAGLRYWDGRQWSPLLPPEVGKSRTARLRMTTTPSSGPASWSTLPMAEERWAYVATAAKHEAMWLAVLAAVSAAFLIIGLVTNLWSIFFCALFALAAVRRWEFRKFFLKLDEAAKRALDGSS